LLFYIETKKHLGAGHHFMITGHTLSSVKRNVLDPMSEMFGFDAKPDPAGTFELHGNKIHCFGADRQDSYKAITGMTAHGWYGNEVTLQHENTIQECFSRISGEDARVFWDTNPDYPEHPIKIHYVDKSGDRLANGDLRVQSWHFELEDNPYLPTDYIENLKASTPLGMWYDRRIKGHWVAAEGLVYALFDRDVHVTKQFTPPADWIRVRSIDFGFTNPFVCLWGAVDYDGRL
jgi:PBSX family phage terminase large subunit